MKTKASLDVGNSYIKFARADRDMVIQMPSVFRDATRLCEPAEDSPIIAVPGQKARQWGIAATTTTHTQLAGVNKADFALEALVAVLGPGTHRLDLAVSHHDRQTAADMARILQGHHRATVDIGMGEEEAFLDLQTRVIREGVGTYRHLQSELGPYAVIVEVGFRTAEIIVFQDGKARAYETDATLGVRSILETLDVSSRFDQDVSALTQLDLKLRSGQTNLPGLKDACSAWYQRLKGVFSSKIRIDEDCPIVFTGGGACLLRSIFPKMTESYVFPANPAIASVLGGLV